MQNKTEGISVNNNLAPRINEDGFIVNSTTGEIISDLNGCSPAFLDNLLAAKIHIGVVKKNMANQQQGYRFTALNYLAQKIYPILKEYDIDVKLDFSKPYQVEYTREIRDKKDKYNPSTWVLIKSLIVEVSVTVYNTKNALTDFFVFTFPMPIDLQQANLTQGMGSSLTYARRYALSLLFGITYDDKEDIDYNVEEQEVETPVMPSSKAANTSAAGTNGGAVKSAQNKSANQPASGNETKGHGSKNTDGGQSTKPVATGQQSTKTAQDIKVEKQATLADNKVLTSDEYNDFKQFCVSVTSEDDFMNAIKTLGVKSRKEVTFILRDKILNQLNIMDDFINREEI